MRHWVYLSKVKELAFAKATQVAMNGQRHTKPLKAEGIIEMAKMFEDYLLEDACLSTTDDKPEG